MNRYEYTSLSPHIYNKKWLNLILLFVLLYIGFLFYKKYFQKKEHLEGFSQDEKFVVKQNKEVYDEFYADIYDTIHMPSRVTPFLMKLLLNNTQVSDKSTLLDIGSGTGHLLNELTELGYNAYGIEQSKDMVQHCSRKYPDTTVKHGNIEDPLSFETRTFSHVLCLYYTIYHMKNKNIFFENTYQWLLPGGYLVLHLVEPDKFDTTIPANWNSMFMNSKNTESTLEINDIHYKQVYKYNPSKKQAILTETFTDHQTQNIRQNEQTWYMNSIEEILTMAKRHGFIPHGIIQTTDLNEDEHQYIYILERGL